MLTRIMLSVILVAQLAPTLADEQVVVPQHNLVTFFDKCRAGGPVKVAYIGGSITAQDGWRPFTTNWLREQFKNIEVKEIDAAIGGTGSHFGAFRLERHVLQYDPDLVFVEFVVNDQRGNDDSVRACMEGIVRQAWQREKKPALVFVYTTAYDLDMPIHRHQAAADAYRIPTVDWQAPIRAVCEPGYIDWQILAGDRVHPNSWGHSIYAAVLATFLRQQMQLAEAVPPPEQLPPPAFSDYYETARLAPVIENPPEGWEVLEPAGFFKDGSLMATKPGQTIEFKFNATMVGLYYQVRKDAGIISCEIDGNPVRELDASWGPTARYNRRGVCIIAGDLSQGEHVLKLTILEKKHELSEGHEFHLGYLMLAG